MCTNRESYELTKSKFTSVKNELDNINQQIHDCKNYLLRVATLDEDYLQEIESLKNNVKVGTLKANIKCLEIHILQIENDKETELSRKFDKIRQLEEKILGKKMENKQKTKNVEKNGNKITNDEVKRELILLKQQLIERKNNHDTFMKQKNELQQNISDMEQKIKEKSKVLACRTEELATVTKVLKNDQDKLTETKLQLESFSKPLALDVNKKGNSLFGEVEDSRLKIQSRVLRLKKHMVQARAHFEIKRNQINILQDQNNELIRQIKDMSSTEELCNSIKEEYEMKVNKLEETIQNCEKQLTVHVDIDHITDNSLQYINYRLLKRWNNAVKLRNKLRREAKSKLNTGLKLLSLKKEIRKRWLNMVLEEINYDKLEYLFNTMQIQENSEKVEGSITIKVSENAITSCPTLTENELMEKSDDNSSQFIVVRRGSRWLCKDNKKTSINENPLCHSTNLKNDSNTSILNNNENDRMKSIASPHEQCTNAIENDQLDHYSSLKDHDAIYPNSLSPIGSNAGIHTLSKEECQKSDLVTVLQITSPKNNTSNLVNVQNETESLINEELAKPEDVLQAKHSVIEKDYPSSPTVDDVNSNHFDLSCITPVAAPTVTTFDKNTEIFTTSFKGQHVESEDVVEQPSIISLSSTSIENTSNLTQPEEETDTQNSNVSVNSGNFMKTEFTTDFSKMTNSSLVMEEKTKDRYVTVEDCGTNDGLHRNIVKAEQSVLLESESSTNNFNEIKSNLSEKEISLSNVISKFTNLKNISQESFMELEEISESINISHDHVYRKSQHLASDKKRSILKNYEVLSTPMKNLCKRSTTAEERKKTEHKTPSRIPLSYENKEKSNLTVDEVSSTPMKNLSKENTTAERRKTPGFKTPSRIPLPMKTPRNNFK